jgi:type IVB pilus formation R64 PilN family outer membrane protein
MPGSSNYMVGQSNQNLSSTGSTDQDNQTNHLNDQQYSNLSGQLSVWNDLEKTLDELKSKKGKVIVSQSTTSVTVHDHPSNVKQMAQYISRLNKSLSQEVGIRVEVLEVQLNKDFNYGIDWNVVQKLLKTSISLTGNLSTATNLVATNLVSQQSDTGLAGFQIGKSGSDNSHFLLNALSQEGRVRVVTKPQVVTMNNQIASIRITQDTGYIKSITSSQFEQYQTTTITPGTITDGFTLYLLPKIQDQNVYMQISSRIANLLSLEKVSNEPSNEEGNSKNNSQFSAIMVPTVSAKEFNQRSVVRSGSTLIIAGYKRLRDQTSQAKMFGVTALGGVGSQSQNVETLVLITPTILKSTG